MEIQTMGSQEIGGGRKQTYIEFLSKQRSLSGLTLSEVQSQLGEPLQSMNLDDLLRNVFPQEMHRTALEDIDATRFVSGKTVDEVWRDIQQQQQQQKDAGGGAVTQQRATLGEMTLEDFLLKAGESHLSQQQSHHYMMRTYVPSRQKRIAEEETVEVMVERRQKRMIKNRESAARSRARKQAYTNELENKIMLLEEENERLRKHKKELDEVLQCFPLPESKQLQLRRSISGPF